MVSDNIIDQFYGIVIKTIRKLAHKCGKVISKNDVIEIVANMDEQDAYVLERVIKKEIVNVKNYQHPI